MLRLRVHGHGQHTRASTLRRSGQGGEGFMHLTAWSALSSRKLARIAALSFWMTALSSAMVFAARTLRMNCLTVGFETGQPGLIRSGQAALGGRGTYVNSF